MARPIYKYQPINETPDVAIGLSIPFNNSSNSRPININYASGSTSGASVFVQTYTTEDQAVSNLKNLLLTQKGERLMQPNFGTDLMKLVFEQDDGTLVDRIRETIIDAVEFWLPYLNLNTIEVNDTVETDDMNFNRFNVKLVFSLKNVPDVYESITFTVETGN